MANELDSDASRNRPVVVTQLASGQTAAPASASHRADRVPGLEDVIGGIGDGVLAVDNEWRVVYVNAAAERLWSRRAQDLVGNRVFDVLVLSAGASLQAECTASKESGRPIELTAHAEIPAAPVELRGYPHGAGYTILLRRVSEVRPGEPAIRGGGPMVEAVHSINQRIFETMLDLILVVDPKGNLIRVSPSSRTILGYDPEEMAGHSAIEFLYPDDLESTRNEMRMARHGRLTRNFDTRYVHKDGRIVPLAWTGIWSEPDQQHFFTGRDMTTRIAAEERSRRAQRLEAIGQLTGGMAHDFNNLLAIVIGNLDLLQEMLKDNAEASELVKEAIETSLSGAELNRQLLAFSRRQPLDPKPVAVNDLIATLAKLLARTLGENIDIKVVPAADLWPVVVDAAQLEAALTNLAVNARDAMPTGGRLTISTCNTHLDADYAADNSEVTPGDYLVLEVTDTGGGMPPDVLARVFEPFFTTKAEGKGTGLGLSMVFGFAKQSGGHLKVYSEIGTGTTVRLYLPRMESEAQSVAVPDAGSLSPRATGSEIVLATEDNERLRRVLVKQLQDLGYVVLEAADGRSALEILRTKQKIDLLLTDVVMPGELDGNDLAQIALQLRPDIKVLFSSGFPQAAFDGAPRSQRLLSKPYRKIDLAKAVRAALED